VDKKYGKTYKSKGQWEVKAAAPYARTATSRYQSDRRLALWQMPTRRRCR
jgi:hypothetical protein